MTTMAHNPSPPPADHKSRDQRVVPVGELSEVPKGQDTRVKRCREIRAMARDFSEDFNYEITCCGKPTKIVTQTFHMLLTVASCAAGILYVMDSMNYTYCKNPCPSKDPVIVGPKCPTIDNSKDNSTVHYFCTHHVYKGIIDYQTVRRFMSHFYLACIT